MAVFDYTLAEKRFKQKVNDNNTEVKYDTYLDNALEPAEILFRDWLGDESYLSYVNTDLDITIISDEVESATRHSFTYDNTLTLIVVNDILILSGTKRKVIAVEDTSTTGQGKVTFQGAYTGSDTTFRLESMRVMQSMFAWLVVYYFFDTAYDLLIGEILADSKQFGDGNISPEKQLEIKRNQYLNNAQNEKKSLSKMITPYTKFTYLIRA